MNALSIQISNSRGAPRLQSLARAVFLVAGALSLAAPQSVLGDDPGAAALRFIEPIDGAIFSTLDEAPISLSAFSPSDVFLSAEVFADGYRIATAIYCCPLCPCPLPPPGVETSLRIPAPADGPIPPPRLWQGWRSERAGQFQLTARAVGENGSVLEAEPVTITVADLTLRIGFNSDGTVLLSIAQGSMVPGRYDLFISEDLKSWTPLGPFSPGAIAAFYWHHPPKPRRGSAYYRAVYVPLPRG